MKQFFRGLKSANIFACHCWMIDEKLKVGILIVKSAKSKGKTCSLKDCDSNTHLTVQIPQKLESTTLNAELLIIPHT